MAGASEATRRVEYVNANWVPTGEGEDGVFELLVVTADGERHTVQPSAAATAALVALTQASDVLLWDPESRTLIVANLVGTWLPDGRPTASRRGTGASLPSMSTEAASSTHVVPVTDEDRHDTSDDGSCACTPFVYRLVVDGAPVGTEVRHNSFDALPVDEEALERAQHAAG